MAARHPLSGTTEQKVVQSIEPSSSLPGGDEDENDDPGEVQHDSTDEETEQGEISEKMGNVNLNQAEHTEDDTSKALRLVVLSEGWTTGAAKWLFNLTIYPQCIHELSPGPDISEFIGQMDVKVVISTPEFKDNVMAPVKCVFDDKYFFTSDGDKQILVDWFTHPHNNLVKESFKDSVKPTWILDLPPKKKEDGEKIQEQTRKDEDATNLLKAEGSGMAKRIENQINAGLRNPTTFNKSWHTEATLLSLWILACQVKGMLCCNSCSHSRCDINIGMFLAI